MEGLKKQLPVLGRIRIGDRVKIESGQSKGKPRPRRLENFRLTSHNKYLLEQAARIYGGEPRKWEVPKEWEKSFKPEDDQWELYTTSNTLNVIIPTIRAVTTFYEQWRAGKCVRRCDPSTLEIISDEHSENVGKACMCPSNPEERHELARSGKACLDVTRINVFLRDVPGFGLWRCDTTGFFGPSEVRGVMEFLEIAGVTEMIPATLRLEQRTRKTKAGVRQFVMVNLTPLMSPGELLDYRKNLALTEGRETKQISPPAVMAPEIERSEEESAIVRISQKMNRIMDTRQAFGIPTNEFQTWLQNNGFASLREMPEEMLDKTIDALDNMGADILEDFALSEKVSS